MIRVSHLSKAFGSLRAVDDVSFDVSDGENLVIVGSSGSGKTTLLRMLNRLIEPTAGSVEIGGRNVSGIPPEVLRRGIGYVMQQNSLFPHYTVAENIAVLPRLLKWEQRRIDERTMELMDKLHLSKSQLAQYPAELSGGQQQRVALARALAANPPVLLMDEPFGALDNVTRARIRAEFRELDELKQKTIVLVTHDVEEAFELGTRIALMDRGRIVQIGAPQALLFQPANLLVKEFLDAQRTQLLFRAVRISDLWQLLPADQPNEGYALATDADAWTALQLFSGGKDRLTFKRDGAVKTVTAPDFLSAFYSYQNAGTHE